MSITLDRENCCLPGHCSPVSGLPRWGSGKESANAGKAGDAGWIPGWGRSPGVRSDNPLQYFCSENSMVRGAWWVTVHGITELDTPERLSMHNHQCNHPVAFQMLPFQKKKQNQKHKMHPFLCLFGLYSSAIQLTPFKLDALQTTLASQHDNEVGKLLFSPHLIWSERRLITIKVFEISLGYREDNTESDVGLFSSFTGLFWGVIVYDKQKEAGDA